MFERYTDRARRSIVLAQDEARGLNHNYIGTEHLMLGLLSEAEGVAGQSLTSLNLTLGPVRDAVVAIIGRGQHSPGGHIPFTPRMKKVLELALREALQLGCNYVGTEHLLLALLREGEGVGCQAIKQVDPAATALLRQNVLERLGAYQEQRAEEIRRQSLSPCACGHVLAHHATSFGSHQRKCEWHGCGCPRYIATSDASQEVLARD